MIFARKISEFYMIIARKNIFPEFLGARYGILTLYDIREITLSCA